MVKHALENLLAILWQTNTCHSSELQVVPKPWLTIVITAKVSRPSNTRSMFGAANSSSVTSSRVLNAQSVSPIPKQVVGVKRFSDGYQATHRCAHWTSHSFDSINLGYLIRPYDSRTRACKCTHWIRDFFVLQKLDMNRGRKLRDCQPFISLRAFPSPNLTENPILRQVFHVAHLR